MSEHIPHYIGGEHIQSSGKKIDVYNPAYAKVIGTINCADQLIVEQAIIKAKQAQPSWANTPALKRAKILKQFANIIESNELELATIVSIEHGKTIADAKASIQRGLEIIYYHCDIQHQLQGSFSHQVSQRVDVTTFYQPLGICAGVAPFNFPVMVPLWMLVPAIACGNAFILKASEKTPSAALKLAEWFELAGLPSGIIQCLQGDADTVQHLLNNPSIQAFTAVGSTQAAQHIYAQASQKGKRCATFGGAKNHAIVMPDANLEHAADAIVGAAFGSAGQRCMAISTVLTIDKHTENKLIPLLSERIKAIRIGAGLEEGVDMGPVISQQQLHFLHQMIEKGQQEGAHLIIDGRQFVPPSHLSGYFIGPSLFSHVKQDMSIYQKELFGPVLILMNHASFEDALMCINENPYGNGAVIFTQSGLFAQEFSHNVQAGMVGINIPIPVPIVSHPFGGWKQSSFGSHPMHGQDSIRFYTHQKSITSTWPKYSTETQFEMPHL
jgi:malonate-semialdehyde dehydrogenase (acetylating)/methylmalonate-semialdehyde dehydrogenase